MNLLSLNADGSTNWSFAASYAIVDTPALAADGTLYFGASDGTFYAMNTNGSILWSTNFGSGNAVVSSPAILPDGSVVVACEDGNLYCFWGTAPLDTTAAWPMFQHDLAHTGQAPTTSVGTNNGAPFVFNGDNDENGHFYFTMTGTPGSSGWNVYATTNLASFTNWTNCPQLATNLTMDINTGNTNFTDSTVANVPQKFYIVAQSNCCSKVIGFVTQTIALSNNLIADQLYQVDDGIRAAEPNPIQPMNSINALFAISNAWGLAQTNTAIFKWNGTGFDGDTNGAAVSVTWDGPGDLTMLPGTGIIMSNATTRPFTNWFNGLIREQQVFQIQPGTSYLSATVPIAGYITDITGYVPSNGDTIKLWNTTNQAFTSYTYNSYTWSGGMPPSLQVGEGFVLITTNTYTWTNTWQPSP